MLNSYTVYMHIFPNNKVYIGITSIGVKNRWRNNGIGYKKQFVYNAIKKYGWKNIKHKILYEYLTKEEAEQKEIDLIKQYKSNQRKYGYNIEKGGHINCVSESTKRKISLKNKGTPAWNKNKKMNDDFKKKCSIARKGKKLNDGLLNAIRKPILCIETNKKYESISMASEKTKINVSNIARVCKKLRKTAGGYHWEYIDKGDKVYEKMEKEK